MEWTSRTPSASCLSSAWSRTCLSELLEQALEVVAFESGQAGSAKPLANRVEDLAGALGIDLVGNLDACAEVGAAGRHRPAKRIVVGKTVVAAAEARTAGPCAGGELLRQPLGALAECVQCARLFADRGAGRTFAKRLRRAAHCFACLSELAVRLHTGALHILHQFTELIAERLLAGLQVL